MTVFLLLKLMTLVLIHVCCYNKNSMTMFLKDGLMKQQLFLIDSWSGYDDK